MSHRCPLPDPDSFYKDAEESIDWRAEYWQCPECRQTWTIDPPGMCYECGREFPGGPTWSKTPDLLIGPEERFDPDAPIPPITLPEVTVARGGIRFGPKP